MSDRSKELSQYPTPPGLVEGFVETIQPRLDSIAPDQDRRDDPILLEPCAYDGGMADCLSPLSDRIVTNDIDEDVAAEHDLDFSKDYLDMEFEESGRPDYIVTNPPYSTPSSHAADFVRKAIEDARWMAAFLLRASFLEPCENRAGARDDIYDETPPSVIYHTYPRPSFTGDSNTDSHHYVWVVWMKYQQTRDSSGQPLDEPRPALTNHTTETDWLRWERR
jgi:hypothetical protein